MATEVKLPEIGEGVTEGELVRWLVKVGDTVKVDQSIAEVMTDKATVEVPTPTAGTVKALKAKEGDVIKVEQVMIELEASGSASGSATGATVNPSPSASKAPHSVGTAASLQNQTLGASITASPIKGSSLTVSTHAGVEMLPPADLNTLATPATRRLARELNVDINHLKGTGLAGRVTREDVLQNQGGITVAAPTKTSGVSIPRLAYQGPAGAIEERVALRGIRKKIAENLQMAKHIIPHFTLMDEANVDQLVNLRESLKTLAEKEGTKITYLPFVMKALIATIRHFPQFNASIDDAAQEIVYKKYFNIGFAADTPNGLVVPVIKNADQKTIIEISKEIIDLSKRARDGKLKPEEMKGATITITNIGSVGGTYATPIINHPEVAILGMYKIQDKVIVENGNFKAVKAMNFTVTADHRLIDGAVAANFLKAFFQRIEQPGVLMADMI
jgi:pyruvate dehydrogenase E2 component (dihydrolipoamide acetyltransferase)